MVVHDENSDIIFITESWTAEHIGEAEINIPGYDLIRKDRMNKREGGCLIYAKEELKVTVSVDDVVRFNTHFYCKHKSQQSAIFDPEATDDR